MSKKTKHPRIPYISDSQVNTFDLGSSILSTAKGTIKGMGAEALNAAGSAVGNALSGGHSSGVGNAMQGLSSIASAIPVYGKFIGPAMNVVGGAINGLFGGPAVNEQAIKENNESNAALMATKGQVSSFDEVTGKDNTIKDFQNVAKNSVFGGGASKMNEEAKARRELAEHWASGQEENAISNLKEKQVNTMLDNYYALGGSLNTNGATFDLGISEILNGGTHEANPNEGVQIGTDVEGIPNLVEEGEVIWKDKFYVFSKRINATEKALSAANLPTKFAGKSMADIATALSKESRERPGDTISKNSRDAMFTRLMNIQEDARQKKQVQKARKQYNSLSPEEQIALMSANQLATPNPSPTSPTSPMFAYGGRMGNMFSGEGDNPNFIADDDFTLPAFYQSIPPQKDSIPYYNNGEYDKGYLSYLNNLTQQDYAALYNSQTPEWRKAHKNPGLDTAKAWGQDGKGGAFTDMLASGYDTYRTKAFNPLASLQPAEVNNIVTTKLNPIAPTITNEQLFGKQFNLADYIPDERKVANAMRASSILPGIYGLLNPPKAHRMSAEQAKPRDVVYTPSGQQMVLNPIDRQFLVNQITAQGNATANKIANSTGTNRGTAIASLLANDYNTKNAVGNATKMVDEYNNSLTEKMATFKDYRDARNAQGAMQAMAQNQAHDADFYRRLQAAQEFNANQQDKVYATRMGNLENLFGNMQNIGLDILNRKDAQDTAKYLRESVTPTTKTKVAYGGKIKKRRGYMC